MGSRFLAAMCAISAGCAGGYLGGVPAPSIPELPGRAQVVEITVNPPVVVAMSTGGTATPRVRDDDDDIRFASSPTPLVLRNIDMKLDVVKDEAIARRAPERVWDPSLPYDYSSVIAAIRTRYVDGLRRCFERIARGSEGGGTLYVEFTVGESGRVLDSDVSGLDDDVNECVNARALEWRFATPYDEDWEPTEARFTVTLVVLGQTSGGREKAAQPGDEAGVGSDVGRGAALP